MGKCPHVDRDVPVTFFYIIPYILNLYNPIPRKLRQNTVENIDKTDLIHFLNKLGQRQQKIVVFIINSGILKNA